MIARRAYVLNDNADKCSGHYAKLLASTTDSSKNRHELNSLFEPELERLRLECRVNFDPEFISTKFETTFCYEHERNAKIQEPLNSINEFEPS